MSTKITIGREWQNQAARFALSLLMGSVLFFFAGVPLFAENTAAARKIIGRWKTVDDKTGEPRGIVEIYARNGELYGKITELFRPDDPVCKKCRGALKGQKIRGMEILEGLKFQEGSKMNQWEGGRILDPETGNVYRARIWREGDTLKVRGYVAFFFRTQTWYRLP